MRVVKKRLQTIFFFLKAKHGGKTTGGCEGVGAVGMRALCGGGLASKAPAQGVNSAPAERELQTHQRAEGPWGRGGETTTPPQKKKKKNTPETHATDSSHLVRFPPLPRSVDELNNE